MIDKYQEKIQNGKKPRFTEYILWYYFYCWCSIDKKVLVVLAVSVLALNVGIGGSISIGLKCGIGTSLKIHWLAVLTTFKVVSTQDVQQICYTRMYRVSIKSLHNSKNSLQMQLIRYLNQLCSIVISVYKNFCASFDTPL